METNLIALRKELGFTHEKMSRILGCSRVSYTKYESGQRNIPIKCLVRLSILYHISIDYLLGLAEKNIMPEVTEDCDAFIRQWEIEKPYLQIMRRLRKERGLTQTQAAEGIACSQQTYSEYELGARGISVIILAKLAQFYDVSTDYILGLKDEW